MRIKILVLSSLFVVSSCVMNDKKNETKKATTSRAEESVINSLVSNTKWQYDIYEGVVNQYEFRNNGEYIFINGESPLGDDIYYGAYREENDTIYLESKGIITNGDTIPFSIESDYRPHKAKFKLILENEKLKHVERWDSSYVNKKWEKSDFVFNDNYLFYRINTSTSTIAH